MFDSHHPNGDNGGNGIYVNMADSAKVAGCDISDLHKVWDSVMLEQCGSYPRKALDAAGKKKLETDAKNVVSKYPKSSLDLSSDDPIVWSLEGFK